MSEHVEKVLNEIRFLSSAPLDIQQKCIVTLYDLLNKLPLQSIGFLKRIQILIRILDLCAELSVDKVVLNAVLLRWNSRDEIQEIPETFDPDGIISDLAATVICHENTLKYIINNYSYSTPVSILEAHIRTRTEKGAVFSFVVERILTAYEIENLSEHEWGYLCEIIENNRKIKDEEYANQMLTYIELKNLEVLKGTPAKKPTWVACKENETEDEYQNRSVGPSKEEIVKNAEIIKDFLDKHDTTSDEEVSITPEDIAQLCLSMSANVESANRNPIERYWGPANAIVGFDCLTSPVQSGPCRMFYCLCRETDNDEEYVNTDSLHEPWSEWFMNECEICKKIIEKFRHAVRFPVDGGGWEGCYCSFECMKKRNDRAIFYKDEIRILEIENILNSIGICEF
jgi:hypothetical protein